MPDPTSMQYYYYLSMSKALLMCTYPGYELDGHYWYDDLCKKLIDLQKPEGYWVNSNDWTWENIPELVTSYSLLSLETRIPIPEKIKRLSYITFILHSNADLHIYDPLGRHVGMNYTTGEIEIQIPNATYYKNDIQKITVPNLESGDYRIILIGTGTGEYNLTIRGTYKNETIYERSYTGNISEGEVHDATVNVAMITGLSIHLTEPPEPMLKTNLTNVKLVYLDPTVTSINVTSLNLSEINETYKPEGIISVSYTHLTLPTKA